MQTSNGLATVTEGRNETDWNTINWKKVNRTVRNLRQRIFRASVEGNKKKVRSLQRLLMKSFSNRALSVRQVTQVNLGKNTAGVDRLLVKTPKARGQLLDYLSLYEIWKAKPTRRIYIPKKNGKLRPLGIPTIGDRCCQAMVKNALEPYWEARFEATSYGFRPGRGCHDAIDKIFKIVTGGKKKWILDADISGAFDNIDHKYLMKTIGKFPAKELIKQWLKAGYIEDLQFSPTESGTPQGGVVSPLLCNIALHGMEEALDVKHVIRKNGKRQLAPNCPRAVVRYADDLVVLCNT